MNHKDHRAHKGLDERPILCARRALCGSYNGALCGSWVRIASAAVVFVLAAAPSAHAELVFFTTGRTLSVKATRSDGESVVLSLRSGGEVVCDRSIVAR